LGLLQGYRLALDVPALTSALGDLICNGSLGVSPVERTASAPLRLVA